MRRLVGIIVVALAVAVIAGAVFVVRPSLAERERDVDERWEPLAEALGSRYDALGILATTINELSDPPREVADDALEEVREWWAALDDDTDSERQVRIANRLEGLAARLEATVVGSSRLATDEGVLLALEDLTARVVDPELVETYNDAVDDYDAARSSLTGQPVAALLDFEARTAFAPVQVAPG